MTEQEKELKTPEELRDAYKRSHPHVTSIPSLRADFSPQEKTSKDDEQPPIPFGKKGVAEFGLAILNYKEGLLAKTVLTEREHEDINWVFTQAEDWASHGAPYGLQYSGNWMASKMSVLGEGNKVAQAIEAFKIELEKDLKSASADKKQGTGIGG